MTIDIEKTANDISDTEINDIAYIDQGAGFHQHDNVWRWVGPADGGDYSDPANWALYSATGNPIPTDEITTGGGPALPQSEQNADTNIGYSGNTTPNTVVVNAPYYNQIRSLSVWQNSTFKITSNYQDGDTNGYVFATAGLENFGTIIVDTSARVELGGVNVQSGTLTIRNNHGDVIFDNDKVNNSGIINLINASLGTTANPITVSGGVVNLQDNSTLVANLWGEGATINVDPATVNTIYLNDKLSGNNGNVQNTVLNGVSANTHFGILNGSSAPVSADYTLNSNGSYTLVIGLSDGRSITWPTVNVAEGYTPPAHLDIETDGAQGWLIEDQSSVPAPTYETDPTHQASLQIVADTDNAGAGITAASEGHSYHQHAGTWRWIGDATGGDWSDPDNWALYDSSGNRVPTENITGSPAIPQSEQNADTNIGYVNNTTPNTVVVNAPYYNQIRSLSVWQNSTLKITGNYQDGSSNGYVFATAGFENYGTIVVDTSAAVELGGINTQAGTLTIMNNDGKVVFDNGQLNNASGTINLINATLGTTATPINVSGGTINLQQGSTILANMWGEGATINVDSDTINTIYINDRYANNDGNVQSTVINNVSGNTHFGILGTSSQPTSAVYSKNDDGSYTLLINLADGKSITYSHVNMAPTYQPPAQTTIVQDGATGWLIEDATPAACFLTGVRLRTPTGDVAVEDIRAGDIVLTFNKGVVSERTVVWTGKNRKRVSFGLPDDEAGYPVRIVKDALGEGIPYQDMLITSEHCLLLDGRFVPVRMLVNGRSIFYDRALSQYDYYHIETEEHSVLIADGVLTESYLDTGNRSSFVSDGNVVSLHSRGKIWASDAAAPLEVTAAFVEPLFRKLVTRAGNLENRFLFDGDSAQDRVLTQDPALLLQTNTGFTISPVRQSHVGLVSFMVPAGVRSVRLLSRASRPCDVIGPFVDDRRVLGVLVGSGMILHGNTIKPVTMHLTEADLSGWYALEQGGARWTNGNANLPLGDLPTKGVSMLTLQIRAAGPYEQDCSMKLRKISTI